LTSDSVVSNEMVMDFSSSHLPWRLDVGRHEALRHKTRTLGEFWAVECKLGGMSGRRGATELRRTEGEHLAVLLVRKGSEIFTQNDKTALVGEGCAVIWDGVKSAECHSAASLEKFTFFLPRDLAREALPGFESVIGRPLESSPSLRLLFSWMETSMGSADMDDAAASTAGRVAVDLLTSAIGASSNMVLDTRSIRLMEVRDFIDTHLRDAALGVVDIAQANAVSIRYLHLLFKESGETCGQYLLRRRLEVAQRLLTVQPGLSVTEIGLRCGFSSPSSFSRAYRVSYGISPRDARRA
jgi:AraC family transcriptional activator of tynA and feaB